MYVMLVLCRFPAGRYLTTARIRQQKLHTENKEIRAEYLVGLGISLQMT